MKDDLGFLATIGIGVATLIVGAVTAKKANKREEELAEEGRRITERDGVIKSKGRYYAYCPKCGRRCGYPQRVKGTEKNPYIDTCTFRCYTCNEDFVKQYDYRLI